MLTKSRTPSVSRRANSKNLLTKFSPIIHKMIMERVPSAAQLVCVKSGLVVDEFKRQLLIFASSLNGNRSLLQKCHETFPMVEEKIKSALRTEGVPERRFGCEGANTFVLVAFDYCELGKKNEMFGYYFGDVYLDLADMIVRLFLRNVKKIHSPKDNVEDGAGDERAMFFAINCSNLIKVLSDLALRLQAINYTISAALIAMHEVMQEMASPSLGNVLEALEHCLPTSTRAGAKYAVVVLPTSRQNLGDVSEVREFIRAARDFLTFAKKNGGLEIFLTSEFWDMVDVDLLKAEIESALIFTRYLEAVHSARMRWMEGLFPVEKLNVKVLIEGQACPIEKRHRLFKELYGYTPDKDIVFGIMRELKERLYS